jgi:Fe2+ transport system protein FeoA
MTLLDLRENEVAEIAKLPSDFALCSRIEALGLFTGKKIRFIKAAPFSGPLLVEDELSGARVMIARSTARQIRVHQEPPGKK